MRAAVCALSAVLAVLCGAVPASAHAALTGSDPAQGSVVNGAPRQVTLTFSEGVTMSDGSVRVLDPSGRRVDTGRVRQVRGSAEKGDSGAVGDAAARRGVGLKSGLGKGTYTVAWQAVSADSHPVSGAFTFSVGAPSKTSAHVADEQGQGAGGGAVGVLYGICRYAAYAGFILLVGGACFVLACWPRGARARPVRRVVTTGWLSLAASTLLMLALRGPYTGSGKLSDALELGGLRGVLETKPGIALLCRMLLLGVGALFVTVLFGTYARRGEDPSSSVGYGPGSGADTGAGTGAGTGADSAERRDLVIGLSLGGTVIAAGLAATWSTSEHASTGIQTGLAMPLDVLHLLAVAGWLGGLVTLLTALYWGPPLKREAARRFSRLAFSCVLVLAATGSYQAWRQVGSWHALTGTGYGRLLLLKVGLVALLVAGGWMSRRWTARLSEPHPCSGPEPGSEPDREPDSEPDREPDSEPDREPDRPAGSLRAAQLARQRAAMGAVRRKKARDADTERSGLRRSVLVEAGIAVILLAVTTALTNTEPGRTQEAARATAGSGEGPAAASRPHRGPVRVRVPFDTGGPNGKGTARLLLAPGRAGGNTMRLTITDPGGRPLDVPETKVNFSFPAKHLGPITVTPKKTGRKGSWRAGQVQVPMPGRWKAEVTVRTSDIDEVTQARMVPVG